VVVVSIGADAVQETLRTALAMGADRAVHVLLTSDIQSLQAAKLLKVVAEAEKPDLIITGKQAIDDDASQTGPMLAALLGIGQGTFASQVQVEGGFFTVTREVDGGHMTVKLALPALVTTDLRLNEPRYATLPNIMKARTKPITKKLATEMGVELAPKVTVVKVEEPPKRKGGGKVKDVAELLEKLRQEAKVL
jgi:electron transfer flavoprotein beta subunit